MIKLDDIVLSLNDESVSLKLVDLYVEEGRDVYNTHFKVHIKNHMFDVLSESLTLHSKQLIKFLHELSDLYFNHSGETTMESVEGNLKIQFRYSYNGFIAIKGTLKELIGDNSINFDYALDQTCFKGIKEVLKKTVLLIK